MSRRLRVAVLAGGRSSEHDVSVESARSVAAALDPARYEVVNVAIGRTGRWELGPAGDPAALPVAEVSGALSETLPVPASSATLAVLGAVDVVLPILHGP
ncbi:MAG TPA: hypothetical protein VNH40_00390, partial [Gaiellaceae bacterium]|nr:hypothetical protein [Gaiellaceae bacterium]